MRAPLSHCDPCWGRYLGVPWPWASGTPQWPPLLRAEAYFIVTLSRQPASSKSQSRGWGPIIRLD